MEEALAEASKRIRMLENQNNELEKQVVRILYTSIYSISFIHCCFSDIITHGEINNFASQGVEHSKVLNKLV